MSFGRLQTDCSMPTKAHCSEGAFDAMVKPTELLTRAQREDALRAFTELTTLDRTDVAAHNGKGDCLRVLEDDPGAFDKKSEERNPQDKNFGISKFCI